MKRVSFIIRANGTGLLLNSCASRDTQRLPLWLIVCVMSQAVNFQLSQALNNGHPSISCSWQQTGFLVAVHTVK